MDGVLVLDKPGNVTSTRIVNRVKRILGVKKAGHVGTLDPIATGVLPVCLNKATRIIPYMDDSRKCYQATMQLGVQTDTMDMTGKVLAKKDIGKISRGDILEAFKRFTGVIRQIPPMYSAVRVNGVRLYDLARKGLEVERVPRTVTIDGIELVKYEQPYITFRVFCSKGTYVRVLCSDIGDTLGPGASMEGLRRLMSCNFKISDSYSIEQIEKGEYELIDNDRTLSHLGSVQIDDELLKDIIHGKILRKSSLDSFNADVFNKGDLIKLKVSDRVVSIVQSLVSSDKLHEISDNDRIFTIKRVLN